MGLAVRLSRAESDLTDAMLRRESQALAAWLGEEPEQLYLEARRVLEAYGHLAVRTPGGRVSVAPMVRAVAADDGVDYADLSRQVKGMLHLMKQPGGTTR